MTALGLEIVSTLLIEEPLGRHDTPEPDGDRRSPRKVRCRRPSEEERGVSAEVMPLDCDASRQ